MFSFAFYVNLFKEWEGYPVIDLAKYINLFIAAGFLLSKLIGRKAEYLEAAFLVPLIKLLQI
ncbi:hypothetical protein D3C80_2160780 [compost metagenome]